jgi:alpha-galactosidase
MGAEEIAFTLCTGLLGRMYLSGHLASMSRDQFASVAASAAVYNDIRADLASSVPIWPQGLPAWTDHWLSLGLRAGDTCHLGVWRRRGAAPSTTLRLPHLAGRDIAVDVLYPRHLPAWASRWEPDTGTLTLTAGGSGPAARLFRIQDR